MQHLRERVVKTPLGERDRWPATGPIYGVEGEGEPPLRPREWFWKRWFAGDEGTRKPSESGPISPIHY